MEKWYHVKINYAEKRPELFYDLSKGELLERIVIPDSKEDSILIDGCEISPEDISQIQFKSSIESLESLAKEHKLKHDKERQRRLEEGRPPLWYAIDSKNEVFSSLQDESYSFLKKSSNSISSIGLHQKYLENILKNTESILIALNITPKSEPDVYRLVKHVIYAVFPKAREAGSNFLKIAKEFKPDILIPEAKAAVEYKYAKDVHKLKATIEQIAADAKGYTGDSDYEFFYAVFYVTKDFWGELKFMEAWGEFDFPSNWIPIYIVGK